MKAWVAGPLLALADQLLKRFCDGNIRILGRESIFGQNFLVLTRVLNHGTRYAPSAVWCVLAALAVARFRKARALERAGLSLLLASGASNLWDQWSSPFVTDSLQIYVGRGQYIPFNLADVGILTGAAFLISVVLSQLRVSADTSRGTFSVDLS